MQSILSACTANGCRAILLDLAAASVDISEMTRIAGLLDLARGMPRGVRLATLAYGRALAAEGMSQILAGASGLLYRTFPEDERAEALAWLRQGD